MDAKLHIVLVMAPICLLYWLFVNGFPGVYNSFSFHVPFRFSYPSILIVYQTITFGVFEVFVLVGFMARDTLYCSSQDLEESTNDPTTYCEFMGM